MFSGYRHFRQLQQCVDRTLFRKSYRKNVVVRWSSKSVQETSQDSGTGLESTGKPFTNVPFAKNLFLGRFDKSMLVYPEISDNDELAELNQFVDVVEKFFQQLDSKSIDENANIPVEVLQALKDLGLFGMLVPQEYGGLNLSSTKYARVMEAASLDTSVCSTLNGHGTIGLKGIIMAGTDDQKAQYLPRLATGELTAAFCLTEHSSGSDASSIQATATLSEDGKTYHLNGAKLWISNGGIADVFTVFAKTQIPGDEEPQITAFIVERAFGGVTNGKPEDKLGIRGSNTCEVNFDNTPVPVENILGEVGDGFKVAMNILNSGRFTMGSCGAGQVRYLLNAATEHASTRVQFKRKLAEFQLIKEKLANMALHAYAMESMTYLTSGVMDQYQSPDCSVEAAMVKVYSSEATWECVNECLQIFGGMGYMKEYPYERYLRDARILSIFEGTNEILRLYIALTGLSHAGTELRKLVEKLRNPFNNLGLVMKEGFRFRRKFSNPTMDLRLADEVHPTLSGAANILERQTKRLEMTVRNALSIYGDKIVDNQLVLKRLADTCIDLYAMTAVIGRCSRSMCIGLRNSDHEFHLTRAFVSEASKRIEKNLDDIMAGQLLNFDRNLMEIADEVIQNKGYAAEHPLTRNW